MRVLVTDGEQRAALAIVRSLGRAGHALFVCARRRRSLAASSRHTAASAGVPPAATAPEAYVGAIADRCREWGIEIVLPVTDAANLVLLPARRRLAPAVVAGPGFEEFRSISDKRGVLETAARVGIAVPEQRVVRSPGEEPEAAELSFPVIVKPSRSVVLGSGSGPEAPFRVVEAADPVALRDRLASLPPQAYPVLLQRKIHGVGVGVFLLRWNGRIIARFAHRRLREKPPAGGVSVYRESIEVPPELEEPCARLLEAHDWRGVAMVEFKREDRTGTAYLMEVNGRFWGSLQLAIDAGVDFPRLLVDAVIGRAPSVPPSYRVGVRTRWWWGDVDHHLARARGGDAAAPRLSPMGVVRGICSFRRGDRLEVLRASDPRPFVHETLDWFAALRR